MSKLPLSKLPILIKLKDLGVESVEISFSGSGDSGDLDDVSFYKAEGKYVNYDEVNSNPIYKEAQDELLSDEMAEYIDYAIEGADWYNNDGGFGTIRLDLNDMTASCEYSQRITEDYSYEGLSIFDEM